MPSPISSAVENSPSFLILSFCLGGRVLIPVVEAGALVGMAQQTVRNLLHEKRFPLPVVNVGSRRFVHVAELSEYLENLRNKPKKTKRGRPTKASQIERAAVEGGAA